MQIQNAPQRVTLSLPRIISAESYSNIIKKTIDNITSVCDFINAAITAEELHAKTSVDFTDYLISRQNVPFGWLRKRSTAIWFCLCLLLRWAASRCGRCWARPTMWSWGVLTTEGRGKWSRSNARRWGTVRRKCWRISRGCPTDSLKATLGNWPSTGTSPPKPDLFYVSIYLVRPPSVEKLQGFVLPEMINIIWKQTQASCVPPCAR